jgi:uncharacterized membrane protein YfcA
VHLDVLDYLAAAGAGGAAGAINALAGGGTLISFSTLVGLGLPPVTANVTNTVSLVPGYLTGAWAQRDDLRHRIRQAWALAAVAFAGGLFGSVLLIAIPAQAFRVVVPYLILLACGLLLAQDWLRERLRPSNGKNAPSAGAKVGAAADPPKTGPAIAPGAGPVAKEKAGTGAGEVAPVRVAPVQAEPIQVGPVQVEPGPVEPVQVEPAQVEPAQASAGREQSNPVLLVAVFAAAVYGGFFGAGLGIMLLAVLGLFTTQSLLQVNALKQALAFVINVVAATFFALSGHVAWELVPVMGAAAMVGAVVGTKFVRKVKPAQLRLVVVVVGVAVAIAFWAA